MRKSYRAKFFAETDIKEFCLALISANFLQASMRKRRKNGAMICGSADDKAAQLKSETQVGK